MLLLTFVGVWLNISLSKGELGSLNGICSAANSMLIAGIGERSGANMVIAEEEKEKIFVSVGNFVGFF